MALPAYVLERIEQTRQAAGVAGVNSSWRVNPANRAAESVLSTGIAELDNALPHRGVLRGTVTELAIQGTALGTTIALGACRAAQQNAVIHGGEPTWCAFVDPSGTLYAPGVQAAGVELERLLVVRPPASAISRVALRLAESQAFGVLVIDTLGLPGCSVDVALGSWSRIVRRLAVALEGTGNSVLLLTDATAHRPLPLPVATRIELSRPAAHKLVLRVTKDKHGRVAPLRTVAWPVDGNTTPTGVLRTGSRSLREADNAA